MVQGENFFIGVFIPFTSVKEWMLPSSKNYSHLVVQ
jgi:hypothetical protein